MRTLVCALALMLWGCGPTPAPAPSEEATPVPAGEVKPAVEPNPTAGPATFPRGRHVEFFTAYAQTHPESQVIIRTRLGDITLRLYEDTPLHRANFLFLASEGYFEGTLFYRIEKGFMVQGGGSDDQSVVADRNKLGRYQIPAEFHPHRIHTRGAVAMARNYKDNPEKVSSSFNFYIVQGERFNANSFKALEKEYGMQVPQENREVYRTLGGAPHLDGEHTVFGEVVSGMDVVDAMTELTVDQGGWPYEDVPMTMEVLPASGK